MKIMSMNVKEVTKLYLYFLILFQKYSNENSFIWYWPYIWNWLISYVWDVYCQAYSKCTTMVIFFSQEEGFYIMTNFSSRFEGVKAAFESALKSPAFQLGSLKTLLWFCSVNIKKPLINSKLMETDEHDEFCWEQQMPGFLQKGVTITWFYQFTNSFFDSTDVLHLYCMFVSIQKNVVPWVCRRRTCHVLHAKLCESNGLSHFTIFFPFTSGWFLFPFVSGWFFCSCCVFICLCV